MSDWLYLAAALVLIAGLLAPAVVAIQARAIDGLVGLELAGTLTTLVLVCLSVGLQGSSFASLALVAAVCAVIGGLVFARFMDRLP